MEMVFVGIVGGIVVIVYVDVLYFFDGECWSWFGGDLFCKFVCFVFVLIYCDDVLVVCESGVFWVVDFVV